MKYLSYAVLGLISIALLSGCKKDEKGNLTVVFQSTFQDNPLVTTDIYNYAFGQRVQFTHSEFFVSNLKLTDANGGDYDLTDIELVDMTSSTVSGAEEGVRLTFSGIPAGQYQGLTFGIGVDSNVNKTVPADYPSSSPLSDPGHYWTAWDSYIFGKTEGNLDTLGNGDLDLGWLFHTGTDPYYIPLQAQDDVNITDGGNVTVTFRLDHYILMGLDNDPVDIKKKPINHNPNGNEVEYNKLTDNYLRALTFSVE